MNLYSNNFKLSVSRKTDGYVYIYNVNFGAFIDSRD